MCVEGGQVCVDGGMREGCGAAASPSVPSVPSTCMHWRTLASSGPCAPLALNVSRLRVCPMMRPCWPPRYDFLPHHLHCWAARRPRRFLRPPSPHAPTPPSHAVMSRCAAVLGRGEGSQGPLGLGWEMGWLITVGACCWLLRVTRAHHCAPSNGWTWHTLPPPPPPARSLCPQALHVLLLPCYCSRCGGGRSSAEPALPQRPLLPHNPCPSHPMPRTQAPHSPCPLPRTAARH